MGHITALVDHYGYAILFVAVMSELIALPLPGEPLMSYVGFLVYQGRMDWIISILVAGLGSSLGMTISYFVGYLLGKPFFEKYGHFIHLGPDKLEKTSQWFKKYGNKLLIIGYFIPGVRHFTGYFSGINSFPFKTYALYAYTGAFIWVTIFISMGRMLGPHWEHFHSMIKKYLIVGSIIAVVIVVAVYLYRKYRLSKKAISELE